MPLDVSFVILPIHSLHLMARTFGNIAWVMKDGVGNFGVVDFTSLSVCIVKSEAEEKPKSFESFVIHMVRFISQSLSTVN